jgi:predicted outer membrane protein
MDLTRRNLVLGSLAFTGISVSTHLQAQTTNDDPKGAVNLEPLFAMKLLIIGRKQIAVCQGALNQLKNEAAIRFAKAEVQEHLDLKKKLNSLGYVYRVHGEDDSMVPTAPQQIASATFLVMDKPLSEADARYLLLTHELATQGISTQKAELAKFQVQVLDRRFIESQLEAHYEIYDHVFVFQKHASPAFAGLLKEAQQIIEQHVSACKELRGSLS